MDNHRLSTPLDDESIQNLIRTALITLCAVGLVVGWSWLFAANGNAPNWPNDPSQARTLLPPVVLLAVFVVPLLAKRLPIRLRSLLLVLGAGGTLLLSYVWLASLTWLYYLSLVVLVAGLLIGSLASFASALILTAALLRCWQTGVATHPISATLPALGLLWGAALYTNFAAQHSRQGLAAGP